VSAATNHVVFAVLEQTRRQVVRNPPAGVSKREAAAWWTENVARIARDLHRQHLPKAPLRQTFQALAAPRPGQRKVAPVADRWVEAMDWAEVLLDQAAAIWEEPETRSSWERWRSLGMDQDEAEPLGDLLGVPDVLPIGSLSDSDRDDLAALALRLHAHTLGAWDLHGEAWQAGRGDSATRVGSETDGSLAPWAARAVLADGLSGARKAHLTAVSPRQAREFVRQHHSKLPQANLRGLLYALGVRRGARLVCVGLVNTPTGRWAEPDAVVELTRVACDGSVRGAPSALVARTIDALPLVAPRGETTALPVLVTYSLTSEEAATYRALEDKGLRPTARVEGRRPAGARGQSDDSLAQAAKIRWEAGPGAGPADWSLLVAA
jgi:hypothetical protein